MSLKQHDPPISIVYELMDKEGYEKWIKEHPKPGESDVEVMFMRFFRKRDDMTAEDFYAGVDPLLETEGD